jgi:4-amino-4-deoxy-L-arabinose transferase-like glycosyltransferase
MTKTKLLWFLSIPLVSLVLFLLLRLPGLNNIPVFVDEAIYVRWSQVMRNEPTLRFVPLQDGKQPLFMWATIPFFKVISDPLVAGRFLSIVAGLGSLIGIGILTYLIFGNFLVAAFSSLVYAVLPFTVFFDRMALVDSLLAMFGVWSLVFTVKFLKTLKLEYAMFLGFSIGAGLLTKSPATIYYVWLLLAIPFLFRPEKNLWKSISKLVFGLLAAFIISQAMYGILRLGPGFQMVGARNQDYLYTWKEVFSHPLVPFQDNFRVTLSWVWLLLTPSSIILFILGFLNSKTRKNFFFLLFCSLIPLLGQAMIAKVYTSRYALYAMYPLIPLTALGLNWLATRKGKLLKWSIVVLILVPTIISAIYTGNPTKAPMPFDMRSGYLEEWTAGWGQKEIATYLIDEQSKGKKIVVFTEGFFGTLPDGIQIYTQNIPNITVTGSDPHNRVIPEGLLNTSLENQRFYVINSSRNHLSAEDLNKLVLVKEYPKPARLDGSHESLLFYRLP